MTELARIVRIVVVTATWSCAGAPVGPIVGVGSTDGAADASVASDAPVDAQSPEMQDAATPANADAAIDPPREPQIVVMGLDPIEAIALDESDAYVLTRAAPGTWRLYRVAKRGGVASRLDDFHAETVSLAVDEHAFYVATATRISEAIQGGAFRTSAYGRVVVAPKVGGGRATIFDGLRAAYGVTVAGASVYWLSGAVDGIGSLTVDSIMKGRASGGGAAYVAMKQIGATSVAADGAAVYFTVAGRFDAGKRTWPPGAIVRAPTSAGKPATLATTGEQPRAIAIDDAAVFWIEQAGSLRRVAKSGGAATLVVDKVDRFVLDGARVAWSRGATIAATPKTGGDAAVRWESAAPVTAIAVDAAFVYFAAGGELRRAPK